VGVCWFVRVYLLVVCLCEVVSYGVLVELRHVVFWVLSFVYFMKLVGFR